MQKKFSVIWTIVFLLLGNSGAVADEYEKIVKAVTKGVQLSDKTKIAVLPFSYLNGRRTNSGLVVSERLTTALVNLGKFSIVERTLIEKILSEQKLALTGVVSDASAQKVGKLSGAGIILSGSISDLKGGRMEVNVRLIETESGKILSSARQKLEKDWVEIGLHTPSYSLHSSPTEVGGYNKGGEGVEKESFKENEEGLRLLKQNKLKEAITHFTKAIELNPSLNITYINRGVAYFRNRDYRKAVSDFSRAIEMQTDNAVAFNNRGAAYLNLRNYHRALENFERALQIAPDYAAAYSNRGDIYMIQGSFNWALKDYTQAIEIDSAHLKSWINRGSAYFRIEDLQKALADYSKAIEIEPGSVEAYINRGFVYFDLKNYGDAAKDFQTAIQRDSNAKDAYAGLGISYLKLGKSDLAKEHFKKAIALDARYKDKITLLTLEGHFYTPAQLSAFREIQLALK